ncbi:hypothetical protein TSUD_365100 [Trifolium subterraneum]|uniref:Reverse transcriptase domain-containing protein n=1 Tax=Trifolium subterraneum TaxID=3900 RepID=A0A2Z6P1R6_TRISU|nr:hypothetical protein TSUD_365100 [Trifolium subterraneum]
MHPLKAPGPDGFQGVFFRQYWHILGDDIYEMINQAFTTGQLNPTLAETLICLIPKVDCPKHFKDFRPISLCNTLYKLITKILVNRLRPMLDSIIGPFQSSFLPGRGTCDNAIILQEIIYNMQKSKAKKGDVAYKIDLEKAYDNVNWNFLRSCLHDFGFPQLTVKLIMHCVSSSSLSLIWNGKRLPNFSPTRGLRQGDPLSPYLFVLCMEKLSLAISAAVQNNSWKPLQISKNGPRFSHLFFADDVLLFSKATCAQGRVMANLFNNFSKASGLRINCAKSRALFSKGVTRRKVDKMTTLSNIRSTTSLGKYLGFPMISGRAKKEDFNFILDKINSRLASWKNKFLNKLGRVTLAKSVLNSIPTYYMQIHWLPSAICSKIDQTTRNFIWKGNTNKGIHLVNWHTIIQTKKDGGLGVRLARETNTAMLGKLVWDIQQNTNKPWVHMIKDKYLYNKMFFNTPRSYGSPIWNSISKAKQVLLEGYHFRISDGSSSLWYSPWLSKDLLGRKVDYVAIQDSHLRIKDVFINDAWQLNLLYTPLQPDVITSIMNTHFILNNGTSDCFIWNGNISGVYSASSGYNWLLEQRANIQDLLVLEWDVSLKHSLRKGNFCADFLAKLGSANDEKFFIWESPPPDMQDLLLSNALRVPYPRA